MKLVLSNEEIKGTFTPRPIYDDIKRNLIIASISSGESIIRNVLITKQLKTFLLALINLGANIRIENDDNNRKKLIVIGSAKLITREDIIDTGDYLDILQSLTPLLLITNKKVSLKYKEFLINNPIDSFHEFYFEYSLTSKDLSEKSYPVRMKMTLEKQTFYFRNDINKDYFSSLLIILPIVYKVNEIFITGDLKCKHYIAKTVSFIKLFKGKLAHKDYNHFLIKNLKYTYTGTNVKIQNDYYSASLWLCSDALGQNVIVKDFSRENIPYKTNILDILQSLKAKVFINKNNDVLVKPRKMNSFEVKCIACKEILPFLIAIACVATGTSKFLNTEDIKNEYDIISISKLINELGGESFIFGGDLIIKGKDILKGGNVNINNHYCAFILFLLSRYCRNKIEFEIPNITPKKYKEFYIDYMELTKK